MSEHTPTRQERREERKAKEATFRPDNRRSVRLTAILSVKPKRKRKKGHR